jgi:hypothetical protein
MKSVQAYVKALLARGVSGNDVRAKLQKLKQDIEARLVAINTKEKVNEFSQGDTATKLRNLYGPKRAPYYYERQLAKL